MADRSVATRIDPVERAPLLDEGERQEQHQFASRPAKNDKGGIRFAGRVLVAFTLCVLATTILFELRLTSTVPVRDLPLLYVASPLAAGLLLLLVITQFKGFTTRVPVLLRLVWLTLVVCVLVFIYLYIEHAKSLDSEIVFFQLAPRWDTVLIPLIVFAGVTTCLLVGAVVRLVQLSSKLRAAIYIDSDLIDARRRAVLVVVPLFVFEVVFVPFLGLLYQRLALGESVAWHTIFIPLWLCDGFFLCIAAVLLLFTCGAQSSAMFSVVQLLLFLAMIAGGIAFKIMLAMWLDEANGAVSSGMVLIPGFVIEALVICCAMDMARSRDQMRPDSEAPL